MRKILLITFAVILFLVFISHTRNNPKVIITRLVKKGYILPGELRYKIYLLGIVPMGEAVFAAAKAWQYNGQDAFHLSATARSLKLFSKFFKSLAVLDSYVDTRNFSPMLFKQKLEISGRQAVEKEIIYDQQNGIMSIGAVKRQILSATQDPLSAVFNIERMDLDRVKELEMNLNTNQKNYVLKGTVTHNELTINKKIYKVFVINAQISRRDKNPYHKSRMNIVLLKDKINIPILIKVFAGEIVITARLSDIK